MIKTTTTIMKTTPIKKTTTIANEIVITKNHSFYPY